MLCQTSREDDKDGKKNGLLITDTKNIEFTGDKQSQLINCIENTVNMSDWVKGNSQVILSGRDCDAKPTHPRNPPNQKRKTEHNFPVIF